MHYSVGATLIFLLQLYLVPRISPNIFPNRDYASSKGDVQSTDDIPIPSATESNGVDRFVGDQELMLNSRKIVQGSEPLPLSEAVQMARELDAEYGALSAGQVLPVFMLSPKALKVNIIIEKALASSLPRTTKNKLVSLSWGWRPRVYGVVYEVFNENGCSGIPLHEDYSLLFRYEVSIEAAYTKPDGESSSSHLLVFSLDDPLPFYIRTKCWKVVDRRNKPFFVRDGRAVLSWKERLERISNSVAKSISANDEDFENDVLAPLNLTPNAPGQFNGLSHTAKFKTDDKVLLKWAFSADQKVGDALMSE